MSRNETSRTGLARALSKLGYCSRSSAAKLIADGQVSLNGRRAHDPEAPVRLGHDQIEVAGQKLRAERKIYLMMNKPRGLVTTASDEQGRETVYSLLPADRKWLAPVGRLDKASEGLLLLTNDSEWGARITAPESHLEKTYHVQIGKLANDALLTRLQRGVKTADDDLLRARSVQAIRAGVRNSWIEIVLDEGRNRHIRRMLLALDIEVLRLIRIAIGPLSLGDLPKGSFREVTAHEKSSLDSSLGRNRVHRPERLLPPH